MRIISKYKDYYDSIQSMGMDRDCVYIREEKILNYDKPKGFNSFVNGFEIIQFSEIIYGSKYGHNTGKYYDVETKIIGFCGKLILVYIIQHIEKKYVLKDRKREAVLTPMGNPMMFYSAAELMEYIEKLDRKHKKEKLVFRANFWRNNRPDLKELEDSFEHHLLKLNYDDWFHHFESPIFSFTILDEWMSEFRFRKDEENRKTSIRITLSPNLKKLEFYKVKDTFTTYQDIYQYLSGVLNLNEDINNTSSDIEKIHQHGFDKKYGFRKRPKKKN